jgi:hypothetical protein
MIKTFNQFPYYDDFKEDKNFYRILFRPGRAVQARELTQMQTILHNQISKIGDHLFKEGALIDATATPTYDNKLEYVKLYSTHPTLGTVANSVLLGLVGKKVVGSVNGIRAVVRAVTLGETVNGVYEPPTLFVAYENKAIDGIVSTFVANEDIVEVADANPVTVKADKTNPTGRGVGLGLNANYVYVKGTFVYISSQLKIVSKYSTLTNKSIGFQVNEKIITYGQDATLLDPAVTSEGSAESNYYATGADRYQITVDVVAIDLLEDLQNAPENFVELIRVDANGNPTISQAQRLYAKIGDELAKRTYEESGNYVVNDFKIQLREHKRLSNVNLTTSISEASGGEYLNGNINKISAVVSPGLAYVKGYRTELPFPTYLEIDKAREYTTEPYVDTVITTGHYVKITNVHSIPDIKDDIPTVNLYNVVNSTRGTAPGTNNLVGTAKIRSIEYAGGFVGTRSAIYHMWLFDIKMNPGQTFARSVKSFFSNNDGFPDFTCDIFPDLQKLSGEITTDFSIDRKANGKSNVLLGERTLFGMELGVLGRSNDYVYVSDKYTSQVYLIANVINDTKALLTTDVVSNVSLADAYVAIADIEEKQNYNYFQPLKFKDVKEVNAARFIVKRAFHGSLDSSSQATISLTSNTDEFFEGASLKQSILVIGSGNDSGRQVSPNNIRLIDNKTIEIDLYKANLVTNHASFYSGSESYRLIVPVRKIATKVAPIYKTLVGNNGTYHEDFLYEANSSPTTITLAKPDGYRLISVKQANSTVAFGDTYSTYDEIDITGRYVFDNGQRDTYYDLARISRSALAEKPTGPIRVTYSYFSHSGSGDYFSVNSYTNIDYKDIPTYTYNGTTYNLSDVVDYRPVKGSDGTFTGSGAIRPEFMVNLNTKYTFLSNVSYYLPRHSIITLSETGRFKVINGSSRLDPTDPAIPDDSMPLFRLKQNAYVRNVHEDVTIENLGIKRYTMKDIRSLENRIRNVEYYTSLNLLEKATEAISIKDTMGLDRFKNGFVVDNFSGFSVSEVENTDYNASIDIIKRELRPNFLETPINLQEYIENDDPKTAIGQKIREAYNIILGRDPETAGFDYWNSVITSQTEVTQMTDAFLASEERSNYVLQGNGSPIGLVTTDNAAFTTPFNRKDKNYQLSGDIISLPYNNIPYIKNSFASSNVSINPFGIPTFNGIMSLSPEDILVTSANVATAVNDYQEDFKVLYKERSLKERSNGGKPGIYSWNEYENPMPVQNEYESSITLNSARLGKAGRENTVEAPTIVKYMPDVNIKFMAKGMKPYTKLYAFFGNRDVTGKIVVNSPSNNNQFITTDLITDIEGSISGTFSYKESELKFVSGVYDFVLTDSPDNGVSNRSTFAMAKFSSIGKVLYDKDGTVRTRDSLSGLNISATDSTYANQPLIVEKTNTPGASIVSNIDVVDFFFMYGFGQKPSAEDKLLAYKLFTTNGVDWSSFTGASSANAQTGAATTGVEMWNSDGTPRVHPILTYVDRSDSPIVVADNETPSDFGTRYFQNADYNYGKWDWFWLNKTQGTANDHNWLFWPATLYQAYYHPTRPNWTSQFIPYYNHVVYSTINSDGRKVWDRIKTFVDTFITREINDKNGIDGYLGYLAREYNYTAVNTNSTNVPIGNPKLPLVISTKDIDSGETVGISTVYSPIYSDQQYFTYDGVYYFNGDYCLQYGEWDVLVTNMNKNGSDAYNPTFDSTSAPTPEVNNRLVGTPKKTIEF